MERKKYIVILILVCYPLVIFCQGNKDIYTAYTSNTMHQWLATIDVLFEQKDTDLKSKEDLLNYCYGYIAWCIGQERFKEAKHLQKRAELLITELQSKKPNNANLLAYESAFIAYRIAYSPYKAPFIGPKSVSKLNEAMAIDSLSWFVQLQQANSIAYRPRIFGGSKAKALPYYLKSIELLKQENYELDSNWNYLNLLLSIGICYTEMQQIDLAKTYYNEVLKIAPEFEYAKQLRNAINKN